MASAKKTPARKRAAKKTAPRPRENAPKQKSNEVEVRLDDLATMMQAGPSLDVDEWETLSEIGLLDALQSMVDDDGNPVPGARLPASAYPALAWLWLRRNVDSSLSWEDARRVIRMPLPT